ncbi:hypothetical protein XBO1_2000017 [Xenorhabdus bovienii str. oregonense]|uniref:Uncharacterized protein n=1 Tax=Xenorhabdus bovienii str. oregonense TaxID=1398202 RepID=A0A077NU86_XENBV|nr:hypothetical protein XBO1_2000017 [Xenorhabdus bovienii str. oregonense]
MIEWLEFGCVLIENFSDFLVVILGWVIEFFQALPCHLSSSVLEFVSHG